MFIDRNRNRRRALTSAGILAGIVCVAAACAHETTNETSTPAVTTTSGPAPIGVNDAAHRLASARCERAAQCNLFGHERPFGNKAECEDSYVERVNDALYGTCAHGVDKARLDKCLAVLSQEMCLEHLGPISSLPECDKTLCIQ